MSPVNSEGLHLMSSVGLELYATMNRFLWTILGCAIITARAAGNGIDAETSNLVELSSFLQPDAVDLLDADGPSRTGKALDPYRCDRPCKEGEKPRICYYRFTVEDYSTLGQACGTCPSNQTACLDPQCVTADGFERGILTVNRRLPGPSIQVCQGDRIVVDVKNVMPGRSLTIHWHGIFHRAGTPFMDGVPMVTQCPINEGAMFRYDFLAGEVGTHFWHSHDGFQKVDGIVGSLIVRQPLSNDPNSQLYDHDLRSHVMLVTDWMHVDADQRFPGWRRREPGQHPETFLMNGKGRHMPTPNFSPFPSFLPPIASFLSGQFALGGRVPSKVPYSVFRVIPGERFRFRMIGAMCLVCPVQISIEGHRLELIATDGTPVEPTRVDKIVFLPGERYDFVLEASEEVSTYWIHLKGLAACEGLKTHQVAILKYIGSPHEEPPTPHPGHSGFYIPRPVTLNPLDVNCAVKGTGLCVDQLISTLPVPSKLMAKDPDIRLLVAFGFHTYTKEELFQTKTYHRFFQPPVPVSVTAMINNISNVLSASPLLSQIEDIPKKHFCDEGKYGYTNCSSDLCECQHLVRVPLGSVVEMVIFDESPVPGGLTHPFHLHGHEFRIMSTGLFSPRQNIRNLLNQLSSGRIKLSRNSLTYRAPTAKDTIAVPAAGYAVVRFIANNPGFWMLHCHFLFHQAVGMTYVLQVGELSDLPDIPEGFPKCGDFQRPVHRKPKED